MLESLWDLSMCLHAQLPEVQEGQPYTMGKLQTPSPPHPPLRGVCREVLPSE